MPLTIELPTYVNFPSDNFYQRFNGKGGVSTIGLFTTELKGTVPLRFIPKGYGNWSVYAGVQAPQAAPCKFWPGQKVEPSLPFPR